MVNRNIIIAHVYGATQHTMHSRAAFMHVILQWECALATGFNSNVIRSHHMPPIKFNAAATLSAWKLCSYMPSKPTVSNHGGSKSVKPPYPPQKLPQRHTQPTHYILYLSTPLGAPLQAHPLV